ncbi:hypothetical protein ACQWFV_24595, partial [Salmonella enterica subsp. enterica serovar Infantis]
GSDGGPLIEQSGGVIRLAELHSDAREVAERVGGNLLVHCSGLDAEIRAGDVILDGICMSYPIFIQIFSER